MLLRELQRTLEWLHQSIGHTGYWTSCQPGSLRIYTTRQYTPFVQYEMTLELFQNQSFMRCPCVEKKENMINSCRSNFSVFKLLYKVRILKDFLLECKISLVYSVKGISYLCISFEYMDIFIDIIYNVLSKSYQVAIFLSYDLNC